MKTTDSVINGLDIAALTELVEAIKADPSRGVARLGVTTAWRGGARTDTQVNGWELGGIRYPKEFTISVDEPEQLLGTNQFANPQEYFMAAMNACITATFVAACSVNGIELELLELRTDGELDLRCFLAIDASVPAGYERISLEIRVKGRGTPEQFEQVHQFMQRTSPNWFHIVHPVAIDSTLTVL